MKTTMWIRVLIFALLAIAGSSAHAIVGALAVGMGQMSGVGEIATSFVADATIETEEMTATGRVYYKPGMVRDEMSAGGQEMVMIRNLRTSTVVMLLGQGMYTESRAGEGNDRAPDCDLLSREILGSETVNGIPTTKYKSVYECKDGKFGGFTWYTDDNIAVKAFMVQESNGEKQRIKYEFTSLVRGAQPDSLFEVPPGYQKLDMGAFAGMQGMGRGGFGAPPPSDAAGSGGYTAPPSAAGAGNDDADDKGNFAGEVADEAQQTATDTAKEETKRGVQDSVRKGIGKLFGR